jgi:TolB-like protein/tetratricopeptide (TPR) repeat protein
MSHPDEVASQQSAAHPGVVAAAPVSPAAASRSIWGTIKHHKVVEWTLTYVAAGYALLHCVEMAGEAFEWPTLIARLTIGVLLLGIPVAATLAWYHGHRARQRVSSAELGILTALLVVAGSILWVASRFSHERAALTAGAQAITGASTAEAIFTPPAHSLAVLPFTNLSGDPGQEYFSDGMSEEMINALSHIDALRVIARTSSFSFKGQNADITTIAHRLNVGAILEGSVRRSGRTVRITVQLINTVSGFHMWSEDYDRDLTNILALESEIATTVSQQLEVKLLGDEPAKIEVGGTHNIEAHDAYFRAIQLLASGGGRQQLQAALSMLDRAVALDDHFAHAYADRAAAEGQLAGVETDVRARRALFEQTRRDAERAVALAPTLAEAHAALGIWALLEGHLDFAGAAAEVELAYRLAPNNAFILTREGSILSALGHADEAIAVTRRAIELDPLTFYPRADLAGALVNARRFTEALAATSDAKALGHSGDGLEMTSAISYLGLGQPQQARALCEPPSTPLEKDDRQYCLALVYHALGMPDAAERALLTYESLGGDGAAYQYVQIYSQWGDRHAALHWLATAVRLNDPGLVGIRVDWMLDPIRGEPDFQALLRQLNIPR